MDVSREYPIRRFEANQSASAADRVVSEAPIELVVNDGELRIGMLCLPRDLEALAVGFLAGENALRSRRDVLAVEFDVSQGRVSVHGDFDVDVLDNIRLRWTRGTGCGGGGTAADLRLPRRAPVGTEMSVAPQQLLQLARQFQARTELWQQTGGVHACALAEADNILLFAEDVGRHNAFDKVIGMAVLGEVALADKLIITTGRLSAEIVAKAVNCGVPILASRSAVTDLAIELARGAGLTLVGFLRGRRLNIYTGYHRIQEPGDPTEASE